LPQIDSGCVIKHAFLLARASHLRYTEAMTHAYV